MTTLEMVCWRPNSVEGKTRCRKMFLMVLSISATCIKLLTTRPWLRRVCATLRWRLFHLQAWRQCRRLEMCLAITIDVKEHNGQGCICLLFNVYWAPTVYEVLEISAGLWEGEWGEKCWFNLLARYATGGLCVCVCPRVPDAWRVWCGGCVQGLRGNGQGGIKDDFFSSVQIFLKVVMLL